MIIKGKSRGGGTELGHYLEDVGENERIALLEVRGTISQDALGALKEMEAYADGTKCENALYHAMICPQPGYDLTPEQFVESVDLLEKELGLDGQPRVVVSHEKDGSEHRHVVWSRIDLERMRAIPDSHNFPKHEKVARELERRFGHPRVQGAHAEREGVERPDRTPSRAELRQEERTGIKGKNVREEVTAAFKASDNADAFVAALKDKGYVIAQGDRRDFVIVDRAGGIHSLSRRIEGMRASELREFMSSIDRDGLPTAEAVRTAARELERQSTDAENAAYIEKAYSRGEDYVSQTMAALKDNKLRQDQIEKLQALAERYDENKTRLDAGADQQTRAGPDTQPEAPGGGHTRSR